MTGGAGGAVGWPFGGYRRRRRYEAAFYKVPPTAGAVVGDPLMPVGRRLR